MTFDKKIKTYLDRWASSPKRPQSYIFHGPEGTGKEEAVHYFVRKISGMEKDSEFERRLIAGIHPDIVVIAPEIAEDKKGRTREKEITISQVRKAQEQLKFFPYELKYKFCFIKKANRLNKESSNALLKALEEPTEKTFFILLAPGSDSLSETIVSRCAGLRFEKTNLPDWKKENREHLRKIFTEEIYERFDWAEKISKSREETAEVLNDWEIIMAEGLRKNLNSKKSADIKAMQRISSLLASNRKAINKMENSNANARTILENLLLGLQWK